jgi:putative nucleotidyltransferase with HDIG domain
MIKQIPINKIGAILLLGALSILASLILGMNLVIATFLASLIAYIKFRALAFKKCGLINIALLFTIIIFMGYFFLQHNWSKFYIPLIFIPLLTTALFNHPELSFIVSLANAVIIAYIFRGNLYLQISIFIGGLVSSALAINARSRMTIIRAGLIAGLVQALCLFLSGYLWAWPLNIPFKAYAVITGMGIISGILVLGILPVFEYLFKVVTNISLLELMDPNHPLLQQMVTQATGTYHHSLIVGNLSDAASTAVGANALLARIGAYYHDIGKITKARYFSENQNLQENKHDILPATISKMIIMNHVKEGLELAKKYRLSPALIDFITRHHGTGLVYYFYRRALENLEEDRELTEEGFRYPGPKPDTKETAIVLLADSVEAATRSLINPSPAKIEETVHKIINNKFIDGQLDECDLALKDIEKISAVFIRILNSIYHNRIPYPEGLSRENNHKESSEENPHLSEKDKKSNS